MTIPSRYHPAFLNSLWEKVLSLAQSVEAGEAGLVHGTFLFSVPEDFSRFKLLTDEIMKKGNCSAREVEFG